MSVRVLVTCPQMQITIDRFRPLLAGHGVDVELPTVVQQLSEEQLIDVIGDYDGVIAGDDPFTAAVIESAGKLRVISKWGVGIDNIDADAAARRGVRVTNTPGVFGDEVANVAVGYLVMLARRLHIIDRLVREGQWPKLEGVSLTDATLGVIGAGSIGSALVVRTLALGMHVAATDILDERLRAVEALGAEALDLDMLLARSRFVVVACPLTADNRHMIGERELSLMPAGGFLVNVSRGALVSEAALADALEREHLAGAALDVYEVEPLPVDSRLREYEACILGSHNASNAREAVLRTSERAVRNLIDALSESS
jgi:D-3-phosphoglycerate dehydrogenase